MRGFFRHVRLLAGAVIWVTAGAACKRTSPPASDDELPRVAVLHASASAASKDNVEPARELTWTYAKTPIGRMRVVVLLPARRPDDHFPVLVTMHGRGEAMKGPDRGARGWVDDYRLPRAIQRLQHPPLERDDFLNFVEETRLRQVNASLEKEAYQGLIVVCPYTPDMLPGDNPFPLAPPLARFIVEELLPRVKRETPAIGSVESTGIDGVSLGGRAAVAVGLLKPEAFGTISALQAALDPENASEIASRLRAARAKNPKLRFRLVTSDGDYYMRPLRAISKALRAEDVVHDFLQVPGPHDYDFNRGPGALEMLLFHDRALRGHATL